MVNICRSTLLNFEYVFRWDAKCDFCTKFSEKSNGAVAQLDFIWNIIVQCGY